MASPSETAKYECSHRNTADPSDHFANLPASQRAMSVQASVATVAEATEALEIVPYSGEAQLPDIQSLIDQDLSEPYSVFTYRYFLNQWPHLCYLAMVPSGRGSDSGEGGDKQGAEAAEASARTAAKTCVGTVVCKLVRW